MALACRVSRRSGACVCGFHLLPDFRACSAEAFRRSTNYERWPREGAGGHGRGASVPAIQHLGGWRFLVDGASVEQWRRGGASFCAIGQHADSECVTGGSALLISDALSAFVAQGE